MKIKSIIASAAFALATCGAQAAVLTFDGLGFHDAYNMAPGMSATERSLSYEEQDFMLTLWTPNTSWTYGAHLGDAIGTGGTFDWHGDGNNGYGSYVTLTRVGGGAFDLTGFDYQNYYGFTISASGYSDITLADNGRNAMPYLNVTEVRFSGDSAYVALDNINVTASVAPAEVPEPGSAALLLAGLGLIGAAARRRKA